MTPLFPQTMKSNFIFSAALLLLINVPITLQAQVIPQVSLGTPYKKVRVALLKEGWTPVRQNVEPNDYLGNEHRKKGWVEVELCAPTGMAPCVFVWQNQQGKRLEVVTVYEDPKFNGFR